MTDPASRRNFLRGRFSARKSLLRPPWALAENAFLDACTRCDECMHACPTHVIVNSDSGYPSIDFKVGECSFCGKCVAACKEGALKKTEGAPPWQAHGAIGEQCLAQKRIECRICGDQCEARAIRFPLKAGGVATPVLESAACTGCGACVAPCPSGAITVVC